MPNQVEVFVVDDNRDAADALSMLIQCLGHTAATYYDGESTLQAARAAAPLCVFLDVNMTGMNGLQLAQALRSEFGDDIILVAVTGAPQEDVTVAQTFDTVDHYYMKPVSIAQVKKILSPQAVK